MIESICFAHHWWFWWGRWLKQGPHSIILKADLPSALLLLCLLEICHHFAAPKATLDPSSEPQRQSCHGLMVVLLYTTWSLTCIVPRYRKAAQQTHSDHPDGTGR